MELLMGCLKLGMYILAAVPIIAYAVLVLAVNVCGLVIMTGWIREIKERRREECERRQMDEQGGIPRPDGRGGNMESVEK